MWNDSLNPAHRRAVLLLQLFFVPERLPVRVILKENGIEVDIPT
jgi:hypothetical protein